MTGTTKIMDYATIARTDIAAVTSCDFMRLPSDSLSDDIGE